MTDRLAAAQKFAETFDVSRETMARLALYVDTLCHWQRTTNLIAADTVPMIWERHITDCAQLIRLAPNAKTWADLGSGAGLPGLVIALMLEPHSSRNIYLIESNGKKVAFLRDVKRRTGAPVEILPHRIESPEARGRINGVEIVTARALASLSDLFRYSQPMIDAGARALFMKGSEIDAELAEAQTSWVFEFVRHESTSRPGSTVVEVRSLKPLEGRKQA